MKINRRGTAIIINQLLLPLASFFIVLFLNFEVYAFNVGEPAPDFEVMTLGGNEISYYKDVRGMKPLYLIFWSVW